MRRLKGKLNISRTSSSHRDDFISIDLIDESSGVGVVEIELSLTDFAAAITGLGARPVEYEVCDNWRLFGMRRDTKVERVIVPDTLKYRGESTEFGALLAPFEVDGWRAYARDLGNPHRYVTGGVNVTFSRYVNPETGEPVI